MIFIHGHCIFITRHSAWRRFYKAQWPDSYILSSLPFSQTDRDIRDTVLPGLFSKQVVIGNVLLVKNTPNLSNQSVANGY